MRWGRGNIGIVRGNGGSIRVPAKIAIVDDDQNILTSISIALEAEGFEAFKYADGEQALGGLHKHPVDLIVLDIKMPRMNGMELLSQLRKTSSLPVIFLTSKDDEIDELLGLKMGADDYITKPFSIRLLIERIRALLRRIDLLAKDGEKTDTSKAGIIRGDLMLDAARHICTWRGKTVSLTVTEFLILTSLANRPGHVRSRDQLLDAAYDEQTYVDDRTIDSHIKRMRKKFRILDPNFAKIETLYGIGYRYKEDT